MSEQTPYQVIAARVALISDQRGRLLSADTNDLPYELRNTIRRAYKYDENECPVPENWDVEDALRKTAAADYLKTELDKLTGEAMALGVVLHAEFITALLDSLKIYGDWQNSTMSC